MAKSPIRVHAFGHPTNPLRAIPPGYQRDYVLGYLQDLGATSVVEEPIYFDRDFLSDFASFYAVSSRRYPNTCRRLHFFSGAQVNRTTIRALAASDSQVLTDLQSRYLGFIVLRPVADAPFGRTVLALYPENNPTLPRIVAPARQYECHLAGVTLRVNGLAWQQQDARVSACATVALWTMLHSSALDEYHAIPTTADITRFAHRTASLGARVFPSGGLTIQQLCEAIKEAGLSPVATQGDIATNALIPGTTLSLFSRSRFLSGLACLVRSGYPALVLGQLIDPTTGESQGRHAICVAGFRECAPPIPSTGTVELQDQWIEYLYVHDDNIGPNVRWQVNVHSHLNAVYLQPSAPPSASSANPNPVATYPIFYPMSLIAAVHEGVRSTPDGVLIATLTVGSRLIATANSAGWTALSTRGLTASSRIVKLHDYLGNILGAALASHPRLLSKTRLALCERVPPMSLHIGLARIGWGPLPCLDVLLDTTDSETNPMPFCHIGYEPNILSLASALNVSEPGVLGVGVDATS